MGLHGSIPGSLHIHYGCYLGGVVRFLTLGMCISLTLLHDIGTLFLLLDHLALLWYEGFWYVVLYFVLFCSARLLVLGGLLFSEEGMEGEWLWGRGNKRVLGGVGGRNCDWDVLYEKGLSFQLKNNICYQKTQCAVKIKFKFCMLWRSGEKLQVVFIVSDMIITENTVGSILQQGNTEWNYSTVCWNNFYK